jgi:hypothetical protein
VTCKKSLSFKFRLFAGIATWKKTTPEEQVVECADIDGEIGYGILKKIESNEACAESWLKEEVKSEIN